MVGDLLGDHAHVLTHSLGSGGDPARNGQWQAADNNPFGHRVPITIDVGVHPRLIQVVVTDEPIQLISKLRKGFETTGDTQLALAYLNADKML